MMRKLLLALLITASGNAFACKCADRTLAQKFEHAPIVFVGSTTASSYHPGKSGQTVSFKIIRSIKGSLPAGATVAIDPLFGTECAAPLLPNAQLLVFAYSQPNESPVTSNCGVFAAAPITVGGKVRRPSSEIAAFLQSHP